MLTPYFGLLDGGIYPSSNRTLCSGKHIIIERNIDARLTPFILVLTLSLPRAAQAEEPIPGFVGRSKKRR